MMEPYFEDIFPKKANVVEAKGENFLNLVLIEKEVIFFNWKDGPYYPVLRLLHKCMTNFVFFTCASSHHAATNASRQRCRKICTWWCQYHV